MKCFVKRYQLNNFTETATNGGRGRIPWVRLKEAQDNFVLPEYLPNGFILTQYHHIRLEDANTLLQHWTQRQASGEIPFRFKNNPEANKRGKRASEDVNAPTLAGPTDQQGTGGRQEQGSNGQDQGDGEDIAHNVRWFPLMHLTTNKTSTSVDLTTASISKVPKALRRVKSRRHREMGEMILHIHPTLLHAHALALAHAISPTNCRQTKLPDHLPHVHLVPPPQHPRLLSKSIPVTTK